MLFSTGTFDLVEPKDPGQVLPLRLTLTPDTARTTARLLLIVPGLAVLLVPAAIASYLLLRSDLPSMAGESGLTLAALLVQPILWLVLLGLAGLSILPRLRRIRVATVTREHVSVIETSLTGLRTWRTATRSYRGIAHHVRATPGVVSHEIILVHDNPARSVLLHTAPMVHQTSLDTYSTLLQLPLIGAREVYRVGWPTLGFVSRLRHAAPIRPAHEVRRGSWRGISLAPKLSAMAKFGPKRGARRAPRLAALAAATSLERQAA